MERRSHGRDALCLYTCCLVLLCHSCDPDDLQVYMLGFEVRWSSTCSDVGNGPMASVCLGGSRDEFGVQPRMISRMPSQFPQNLQEQSVLRGVSVNSVCHTVHCCTPRVLTRLHTRRSHATTSPWPSDSSTSPGAIITGAKPITLQEGTHALASLYGPACKHTIAIWLDGHGKYG